MTNARIAVIGDMVIDCVADLAETDMSPEDLQTFTSSSNTFGRVEFVPGGSGLQVAVAAVEAGFDDVAVIGKIGAAIVGHQVCPDLLASNIIEHLDSHVISHHLAIDASQPTGRVMILFTQNRARLMVSDPASNMSFCIDDITPGMTTAVCEADIVHVSGYWMLQPHRRQAALELCRIAKAGSALTVLDIVPHDIYQHLSLPQLQGAANLVVDLCIVELATAHQLVGLGRLADAGSGNLDKVLARLETCFPSVAVFEDPRHATVTHQGRRWSYTYTGEYVVGRGNRGFSARVQTDLMLRILQQPRRY